MIPSGHEQRGGSRTVPFFDAHCDTALKVLDGVADFVSGEGSPHVTYQGMQHGDVRAQIFAAYALNARHPGKTADRVFGMIDAVRKMAEASDGGMRIACSGDAIRDAFRGGPMAAILGIEGADCLEGRAENLRQFVDAGVRDLIFAWADNPFSGTVFGDNGPLTDEGRELLALAEELRVMVDVSHISDSAFVSVCDASTRPFIASHSNCRHVCPHPRNLTDAMIRALADRGGVMGINLALYFLDPEYCAKASALQDEARRPGIGEEEKEALRAQVLALPRPGIEKVGPHVIHAINVGGEDCIGMGGDLDGIPQTPVGIDGVADYQRIVDVLGQAGLTDRQIEKFCYLNFVRVFGDVLGEEST